MIDGTIRKIALVLPFPKYGLLKHLKFELKFKYVNLTN